MSSRTPLYDNLKFLLVWLVVIGHFVEGEFYRSGTGRGLYLFIYSFHIPAFAFVSGVLSKKYANQPDGPKSLGSLLLPYFAFQILYGLWSCSLGDRPLLELSPLRPVFAMWFLPALFFWRALLPLVSRRLAFVPIVFAVALMAGWLSHRADFFAMERIVTFFPFFVLGAVSGETFISRLGARLVRLAAGVTLVAAFVGFHLFGSSFNEKVFFGSKPFSAIGYGPWEGLGHRAIFFAFACVLSACLLSLVPRRRTFFTALGERSMTVYLLHGFLAMALIERDWLNSFLGIGNSTVRLIVLVVMASTLTGLLSIRPLHLAISPLTNAKEKTLVPYSLGLLLGALLILQVPSLRAPLATQLDDTRLEMRDDCPDPIEVTARGAIVRVSKDDGSRQVQVFGPDATSLRVTVVVAGTACDASPLVDKETGAGRNLSFSRCKRRGRVDTVLLTVPSGKTARICGVRLP